MRVDIICEVGINHDGSFEKAVSMIIAAAKTGVKIVKFQHYDALKLLGKDSPYLEYATKCQFTKRQHEELKQFCDDIGMEYLVSTFDVQDVLWADSLSKRHKVASRMNQNQEFIAALLNTNKEVIISIQDKRDIRPNLRNMYCITEYPTSEVKLQDLPCNEFLGLSSHCPSIVPSLNAVAQGANLIEHHVCFSREEEGCDKSSSITFDELAQLNLMVNKLEVV